MPLVSRPLPRSVIGELGQALRPGRPMRRSLVLELQDVAKEFGEAVGCAEVLAAPLDEGDKKQLRKIVAALDQAFSLMGGVSAGAKARIFDALGMLDDIDPEDERFDFDDPVSLFWKIWRVDVAAVSMGCGAVLAGRRGAPAPSCAAAVRATLPALRLIFERETCAPATFSRQEAGGRQVATSRAGVFFSVFYAALDSRVTVSMIDTAWGVAAGRNVPKNSSEFRTLNLG